MKCIQCSGDSVVQHTKVVGDNVIKRRRTCNVCASRFTTYERFEENPTGRWERRLTDNYRELRPHQKEVLWAFINMLLSLQRANQDK